MPTSASLPLLASSPDSDSDEGADKAKEREKPAPTHTAKPALALLGASSVTPVLSPKKRRADEVAESRVTRSRALVPGGRLRERKSGAK